MVTLERTKFRVSKIPVKIILIILNDCVVGGVCVTQYQSKHGTEAATLSI